MQAREAYAAFLEQLRGGYGLPDRVQDGVFGAMMDVGLVNDGPVTFLLDSADPQNASPGSSASMASLDSAAA
jgi:D-tyrosyl-tRNA(Tyr) deacylase